MYSLEYVATRRTLYSFHSPIHHEYITIHQEYAQNTPIIHNVSEALQCTGSSTSSVSSLSGAFFRQPSRVSSSHAWGAYRWVVAPGLLAPAPGLRRHHCRFRRLPTEGDGDNDNDSDDGDNKGTAQASEKEPPASVGRGKRASKAPEKAGAATPPKKKQTKQ